MLATNNILLPSSGRPIAIPSQDIVLGCYYLTKARKGAKGDGHAFMSTAEAIMAYEFKLIDVHALINVRVDGQMLNTTVGRLIFNSILPKKLGYFNEAASKGKLEDIVSRTYWLCGQPDTVTLLDRLKNTGFEYATRAGMTVSIGDFLVPDEKQDLIATARKEVAKIQKRYEKGVITNGERYNQVIDTWTRTGNEVGEMMFNNLAADNQGFNPIFMMADSGARGSKEQIRQLAGMRGLMAKPQKKITGGVGEIIETPVISNFREGLTVQEYFISTHGARKGLADTALKTADAGYLTRRLVDVAQDVIVRLIDCETILGLEVSALKEGEEIIESLRDRILGRVTLEDVYDPIGEKIIVAAGDEIKEDEAVAIEEAGIDTIRIRSVLTCESKFGVCAKCYGRNLSNMKMADIGEAIGVIAAQSIGEPGTQLTLRTFHIGGTAARIAEQSRVEARYDGSVKLERVTVLEREDDTPTGGKVMTHIVSSRDGIGEAHIIDAKGRVRTRLKLPYAAHLFVTDGQEVKKGDVLFEWDPYTGTILSEHSGTIQFEHIIKDVTFREEIDDQTGLIQQKIIEHRDKTLFPTAHVVGHAGKKLASYRIPTDAQLHVSDGAPVRAGDALVKIPRYIAKSRDITGGLPRVAELFEARRPSDPSVISEVDGAVEFGKIVRGQQQILVKGEQDETREYLVPHGKHLMVHDGDFIRAGERLCEGSIDPHDILKILGVYAVQSYLVNEIQEVYRLQGVKINDKHIEIIVRQMLQKVEVGHSGDTNFLEGEKVDKSKFNEENARVIAEGGENATATPLLLGITRASLSTESFISAASFQETTRVLTEAAITGKLDNLLGLKENVIIGHLIPAGTGIERYRNVTVVPEEAEETQIPQRPSEPSSLADIFKEKA
jgi:DNA-directed RNA polymerase subunit beta'